MSDSPPKTPSPLSRSVTLRRKRCTHSQPDARVVYSTEYKRWTVYILPQCHVKTFRSRQDALNYADTKKTELARKTRTVISQDIYTQQPVLEV